MGILHEFRRVGPSKEAWRTGFGAFFIDLKDTGESTILGSIFGRTLQLVGIELSAARLASEESEFQRQIFGFLKDVRRPPPLFNLWPLALSSIRSKDDIPAITACRTSQLSSTLIASPIFVASDSNNVVSYFVG